jgi:5-methyltetrahydrofolate--homocysteine methyltransferase
MPFMKLTIEAIRDEGLDIPVIIGGAPVSQDFADKVNAHGYGDNAPNAVKIVKDLIEQQATIA